MCVCMHACVCVCVGGGGGGAGGDVHMEVHECVYYVIYTVVECLW